MCLTDSSKSSDNDAAGDLQTVKNSLLNAQNSHAVGSHTTAKAHTANAKQTVDKVADDLGKNSDIDQHVANAKAAVDNAHQKAHNAQVLC